MMAFTPSIVVSFLMLFVAMVFLNYKISVVKEFKNFTDIAKENGYSTEEHIVTTKDGYRLAAFRMRGKNCKNTVIFTPVLLMHGLFESSDLFIDAGPDAGLAYLLSDACYDLWVGNTRGNYYGRSHISLDPEEEKFWNFSADEIGFYDLPAKIDYILNLTRSAKINFIGYSQGGSIPFLMCSEIPEYCDKLGVIISLAPATRLNNMRSKTISYLFKIVVSLEELLKKLSIYELFPRNGIIQQIAEYICDAKMNFITRFICESIVDILDVHNPGSITDETFSSIFKHFPGGSSIRNTARYGQILNTGKIQKYDFGEEGNIERYGTIVPPVYNLQSVSRPVVILNGENDYLTSIKDSEWAMDQLPNSELFIVEDPSWNHLDMVYSQHINKTIFTKINYSLLRYS